MTGVAGVSPASTWTSAVVEPNTPAGTGCCRLAFGGGFCTGADGVSLASMWTSVEFADTMPVETSGFCAEISVTSADTGRLALDRGCGG